MPRLPEVARKAKLPGAPEELPKVIPVVELATTSNAVINNILARELTQPSGPIEAVSPTVGVLAKLVSGIMKDDDISEIKDTLTRIASNPQEKSDLFTAVLNQIDRERVTDYVEIRAGAEKRLKRAYQRGDLTSADLVTIINLANDAIQACQSQQKSVKAVDTITIVEKVDLKNQEMERSVQQRWEGTTPQGREIIRKKLYSLKKQLLATVSESELPMLDVEAVPH